MAAKVIDGSAIAADIIDQLHRRAEQLKSRGRAPLLAAVLVGDNPAAVLYSQKQQQSCKQIGVDYRLVKVAADATKQDVLATISSLNAEALVTGILLQMPLPSHLDPRTVQMSVAPSKDVEGVHPMNMGRLVYGDWIVAPCTPMAAVTILRRECPDLAGKEVVVVGHSDIVGKPIATILLESRDKAPTVTVCHMATKNLVAHTRKAEILVVATGAVQGRWLRYQKACKAGQAPPLPDLKPLVDGSMIAPGAIVIDVGVNRIPRRLDEKGKAVMKGDKPDMVTVGDVDFASASEVASAITPVPGGVGPVTVAMLLKNLLALAEA